LVIGGLPTGLDLLAGAPNFASTAAIDEPRCGVSTPDGLTATWPSMAKVSLKAGAARTSPMATSVTLRLRASISISHIGRRLDRGRKYTPRYGKVSRCRHGPTPLTALL
jgi:hypothetical protein